MLLRRIGALALSLLVALPAATAQADEGTTAGYARASGLKVEAPGGALRIDPVSCANPVRFRVTPADLPAGGSFDVAAVLRNNKGQRLGRQEQFLVERGSFAGAIYPRCGAALKTGTYTLTVRVKLFDAALSPVGTVTGSTKVRLQVVRPAPTRLVVTKRPYGSRGWSWTARLTNAGRPVAGQRVDLWWDLFGWEDYEVSKRTDRNGVARWVSNPDGGLGGIKFKVVFEGSKKYAPSESAVFTIAPR